jgi:hypothetical protein
MQPSYAIVDEPRRSAVSRMATRPYFPLLALMLGGCWLAWPWFAFNSFALGSATRAREIAVVAAAFVGSGLLAITLALFYGVGILNDKTFEYAAIVLVIYKLGMSYWMHSLQEPSAELYAHYGGALRNGAAVVVLGLFLRSAVMDQLHASGGALLVLVLG